MYNVGDFDTSSIVDLQWTTVDADGTPTAVTSGSAVCRNMRTGSLAPQGVSAITTSGGMATITIFTGSNTTFFAAANDFSVYYGAGLITTTSVIGYIVGRFSIRNRTGVYPTVAGRTLDVSAGGEAGVDWANVGSPTTTLNLSGTTVAATTSANIRQLDGSTVQQSGGYIGINWNQVGNPTSTVVLSGTTVNQTSSANMQYWRNNQPNDLVSGRVDASAGALATGVIASGSFAAGAVDAAAIAADAIGASEIATGAIDADALSAGALADINAEVVDALNVDTYAEPGQGAPAATTTLVGKIGYLYKFLRNRVTSTSSQISVYNDDALTIDQKSAQSDDGTTYDRPEFGSGP